MRPRRFDPRSRARLHVPAETPGQRSLREDFAKAGKLALADLRAEYPVITAENAEAALAYQDRRDAYHRAAAEYRHHEAQAAGHERFRDHAAADAARARSAEAKRRMDALR